MPDWLYHCYDRATGDLIDSLPFEGVTFGQKLNAAGEFKGKVPVGRDGVTARRIRDATMPLRTMLCVQRDNALVWGGIVTAPRDRKLGDGTADITATELVGLADGWFMPTLTLKADQVQVARTLVEGRDPWLLLPEYPGDSGTLVQKKWSVWDYTPVSQSLAELNEATGGIEFTQQTSWDFFQRPLLYFVVGTPKLGRRNGDSGLVLEYNADVPEVSNVIGGTLTEGKGMATRTWATSETDEGVGLAAKAERLDLLAMGYPMIERHEAVENAATTAQLQRHADALQQASSAPTLTVQLTVAAGKGFELGDFSAGDDVRVRVTDPWWPAHQDGTPGLDTWMRLVEYEVTPDQGGLERYVVTMADMTGWW
ncbi:hypothetical protein [Actinomadura yumaensis]|uniref:Minor tail protein n=1 Tax=Actinomadura yumaensis TaxID=111807 RepID=A0ABW2CRX3_9ACTN